MEDLLNKQAWIAFRFDNEDLAPEHGGPARLLVPHGGAALFRRRVMWRIGRVVALRDETATTRTITLDVGTSTTGVP